MSGGLNFTLFQLLIIRSAAAGLTKGNGRAASEGCACSALRRKGGCVQSAADSTGRVEFCQDPQILSVFCGNKVICKFKVM